MVYRCEGDIYPDLMVEILEHGAIKVLGIVNGDLLGISIETDDVLPEEFLDGGGGCVRHRLRFNPFGEVFHCNNGEGVVSLCWCKLAHDVYICPTAVGAMMGQSTMKVARGPCSGERILDKLHKLIQVWLHQRSWPTSRILAGGPWLLVHGHRCGLCKL
jgi:hypothetical protein